MVSTDENLNYIYTTTGGNMADDNLTNNDSNLTNGDPNEKYGVIVAGSVVVVITSLICWLIGIKLFLSLIVLSAVVYLMYLSCNKNNTKNILDTINKQ